MATLSCVRDFGEHAGMKPDSVPAPDASDGELLSRFLQGKESALEQLMDRYDRLVRYTIFRSARQVCRHDADWLDSVASDVWMGLLRALKSKPFALPRSLPALLTTIAARRTISALRERTAASRLPRAAVDVNEIRDLLDRKLEDPAEAAAKLETLEALRSCSEGLEEQEARMMQHLELIIDRNWDAAGNALGWPESTVRSRWTATLQRIADCVRGKVGRDFAPK